MATKLTTLAQGLTDMVDRDAPESKRYLKRRAARLERRANRSFCREILAGGTEDFDYYLDDAVFIPSGASVTVHSDGSVTISWS